jgi:hypothetical protein
VSIVQQVGYDGQNNASQAVTIASSTAGNTLIVVAVPGTATTTVPSDNLSTVWPASTITNLANSFLTVWLLQNCPSGITTITVHIPGGGQGWVVEESGLLTASLDKSGGQSSSGTTVSSPASGTLSQANEVVYGFFGHDSNNLFSAGAGFDSSAFTNYGGSGGGSYTPGNQGNTLLGNNTFIERQVVTVTTSLAATATIASSTVDAAIITLKQGVVVTPPFTPFTQTQFFVSDLIIQQ